MTRPNATRTVAVETPVAAAICCKVRPVASSFTIRPARDVVSLLGRRGPGRSVTNPTTPPTPKARFQRHNVASLTPNADATSATEAMLVVTSCTAANRRPAAVQLVTTKIASVAEVASAFGVNEATLWRWKRAFGTGGVVGLVAERPGPRRPSKLTKSVAARIVKLAATGLTLQQIAAAAGVSTATVRVALGRVTPRDQVPVEPDVDAYGP